METKMKVFCNEEHLRKIDDLGAELWTLQRAIEMELSTKESLDTYEPIVELLKQASWLVEIASNICYYGKPF